MRIYRVLAIISFALILSSSISQTKGFICGEIEIDDHAEVCCNFKVYNKTQNGKQMECCEGTNTMYVEKEQLCCGRNVVNQTKDLHWQCCGDTIDRQQAYLSQNQTCCGTKLIDPVNKDCCDGVVYSPDVTMCCAGVVRPRDYGYHTECCGNVTYNNQGHNYCALHEVVLHKDLDVCDGHPYNVSKEICCAGTLKVFPSNDNPVRYDCCGQDIKLREDKCCAFDDGGQEWNFVIRHYQACCGNSSCDEQTHACCQGKVVPKGDMISPACCGNRLIDQALPYTKCCKGTQYDSLNHQCCGSAVLPRKRECCGARELNPATEVCCRRQWQDDFPVNKAHDSDTHCCVADNGDAQPYNQFTQNCTKYGVVSKVPVASTECRKVFVAIQIAKIKMQKKKMKLILTTKIKHSRQPPKHCKWQIENSSQEESGVKIRHPNSHARALKEKGNSRSKRSKKGNKKQSRKCKIILKLQSPHTVEQEGDVYHLFMDTELKLKVELQKGRVYHLFTDKYICKSKRSHVDVSDVEILAENSQQYRKNNKKRQPKIGKRKQQRKIKISV